MTSEVPARTLPESTLPPVVSKDEWDAAREALLVKEKETTRAWAALAAERRKMPMVRVDKDYRFEGPNGEVGLLDLFDGRRQLVVYRAFFEPGVGNWPHSGCPGCSFFADHVPNLAHVHARDTTFVFASPADQDKITAYQKRMDWHFPWFTLVGDAFARDFDVVDYFAMNVFIRNDADEIFLTYRMRDRGSEWFTPTWAILDMTPLGRQEEWEDTPDGRPQTPPYQWWRLHDEY